MRRLIAIFSILALTSSCALFKSREPEPTDVFPVPATAPLFSGDTGEAAPKPNLDRFGTHYMALTIGHNMPKPQMSGMPIVITTFVDLNDLGKTSVFGRMMAEKMIDEMTKMGFHVVEFRKSQDIFVRKDGGEFILTRDVTELAKVTNAMAVLAGTYIATSKSVIINARLIDIKTPRVLSTASYDIERTDEVEGLLSGAN
jgi:TolB-like protein